MNARSLALGLALASGSALFAAAAPAGAQGYMQAGPHGVPPYRSWQPGWNHGRFDARHVILGTVTRFQPYRLQIASRNGNVETIDLKGGTVILPTGVTPKPNERVAVVGYYSNGTFIANRVIVRG